MSVIEKLGIQLDVTGDAVTTLNNLLSSTQKISEALKGISMNNLTKAMEDTGKTISSLKEGEKALDSLKNKAKETADELGTIPNTSAWKEFMAQNMSTYLKLEGTHGSAIARMVEDWKIYKEKGISAVDEVVNQVSSKMELLKIKNKELSESIKVKSDTPPSKQKTPESSQNSAPKKQEEKVEVGILSQVVQSFNSQTKELVSSLTSAASKGLASTFSTSYNVAFHPDKAKINEIQATIDRLSTEKKTLEVEINALEQNPSEAPEKILQLNEKKISLDSVSKALAAQEQAIKKQEDVWLNFTDGLGETMKRVFQALDNYANTSSPTEKTQTKGSASSTVASPDGSSQTRESGSPIGTVAIPAGKPQTKEQEFVSSLTTTATNGLTSTLSSSFNIAFNPDKVKINEIQAEIDRLSIQKKSLEGSVKVLELNSSKTPQEIQQLNEKKLALDNVNRSLDAQEQAIRKQKDAWANFSEGLKGVMKQILQRIQEYIAGLMSAWLMEKVMNIGRSLLGSFLGSGATTSPNSLGSAGTPRQLAGGEYVAATGGLVTFNGIKNFAAGGIIDGTLGGRIPLIPGSEENVDSVPILTQPGEIIIKKSSVDYYGSHRLLALNDKKIQKFADGGIVGGFGGSKFAQAEGKQEFTLQIVNIAQNQPVPDPGQNAQQIINVIGADIAKRGSTFKSIKAAVNV